MRLGLDALGLPEQLKANPREKRPPPHSHVDAPRADHEVIYRLADFTKPRVQRRRLAGVCQGLDDPAPALEERVDGNQKEEPRERQYEVAIASQVLF